MGRQNLEKTFKNAFGMSMRTATNFNLGNRKSKSADQVLLAKSQAKIILSREIELFNYSDVAN